MLHHQSRSSDFDWALKFTSNDPKYPPTIFTKLWYLLFLARSNWNCWKQMETSKRYRSDCSKNSRVLDVSLRQPTTSQGTAARSSLLLRLIFLFSWMDILRLNSLTYRSASIIFCKKFSKTHSGNFYLSTSFFKISLIFILTRADLRSASFLSPRELKN